MSRLGSCLCSACGKDLAPKSIHVHTENCKLWKSKFGDPFPYFKFSASPVRYTSSSIEGVDYVRCCVCAGYGWDFRFLRMGLHLKVHGLTEDSYLALYPGKTIRLELTNERRKKTVQEIYGVDNVFQSEIVKARSRKTLFEKYGVEVPLRSESIKAKASATNLKRYGAENPFASEVIKEKIKQVNLERYGVDHPNKNPEMLARTFATNLERYGKKSYVETEEFQKKFKETSLAHFGVEHPMLSEKGKELCRKGCEKIYGVSNPLLVPEIHEKTRHTTKANHGGVHHLADPTVIEARKRYLLEKYGVDNISKVPAIKEKIIAILKAKWDSGAVPKMNNLERFSASLFPENVVYSGDWSYWTTWVGGTHKNPDFVVLTKEQLAAYKAGTPLQDLRTHLVVEINGDFWHTKHKGLTRGQREKEFVEGYASVGIFCLVLWGSDILSDTEVVSARIQDFLNKDKR
jgi:hypothetical protein